MSGADLAGLVARLRELAEHLDGVDGGPPTLREAADRLEAAERERADDTKELADWRRLFDKLAGSKPLLPDPDFDQDVAFVAFCLTQAEAQLAAARAEGAALRGALAIARERLASNGDDDVVRIIDGEEAD